MKKLILLLFALPFLAVNAQELPVAQPDSKVKTGKLANGLTYYIRHNNLPENRADFYIAQRVGAVQEEESQRGLAHFLEHMCFNGTEHFPGNGIIEYLQSIGIEFGRELNAYTAADETVYNINNVPVTEGHVDSCLLILHDWSNALLLEAGEIDKERGVIHEEWRMRSSAMMRILERNLEKLYPNSRYGRRFPIGLMSVIDNFTPDTLRAYYHKWYRPDLQGIVVVGDIDVDQVEAKIKTLFAGIKNPENEAKFEYYPVPDNAEPIYVVDKDKEQSQALIELFFKQDPLPRNQRGTWAYHMMDYMKSVITNALDARFAEISQKADCPFLQAGCGYADYIMTHEKEGFAVSIIPKPGKSVEAVQAVMQELLRLQRHGFVGSEVIRARETFMSKWEALYNNREKQENSFFVNKYVRGFLDNSPISSIEDDYNVYKMLAPQLPAEYFNMAVKEMLEETDTNFVFLAFYPEKDDVVVPSVEEFRSAVAAAKAAKLDAYVDNVKNEPLITKLPKPGKIKKETPAQFGYTKWTLSNGANVYYKKTDYNESQVVLGAQSWGGLWKVKPEDYLNARILPEVMNSVGLGNFKNTELEKALAGKRVSVSMGLGQYSEILNGSSTPKDLRTMFELIHLYFTAPGNDIDSYNNYISTKRTALENADKQPQTALADSLYSTIFMNHPFVKDIKVNDLDKLSFDAMKRIYKERFASAGDFDFYFTGNIDVDSLRAFTETYLASLPGQKKRENVVKKVVETRKGEVMNRFERKMETPQSYIIQMWMGDVPYTMKESLVVDALGEILTQRYLKSIREEGSMAYSVFAGADVSYGVKDRYTVQVVCPVKPAKADSALLLMRKGITDIAANGVTAEELSKVVENKVKKFAEAEKDNNYWEGLIKSYVNWGKDERTNYVETYKSVTSDDIRNFVNNVLLKQMNCSTVLMLPDDFKEEHFQN